MGKIIELKGRKNRWSFSSLGARILTWEALDGTTWRKICRGDGSRKTSEDNYHAAVMFPWVNRIGGDHWSCEGHPVPVNTSGPLTHLHGLTFDAEWETVESDDSHVIFHTVLEPGKFYPRKVEATVAYVIGIAGGAESLEVGITCKNLEKSEIAYVTTGIHPYFLNPFGGKVDEVELFCAAEKEFAADDKLIPTGIVDVMSEHDFRKSRKIGATTLDNGFILKADKDPAAGIAIKNFKLWIHPRANCGYAQIYIPPHREEIAIEPQTGGADAFRFHQYGLKRLQPGETFKYLACLAAVFS